MNKSVTKAIHYAAVLTILGVVCAAGVAGLYAVFKPTIDRQKSEAEQKALRTVLPTNVITFSDSGMPERVVEAHIEALRTETLDAETGKPFTPQREKDKLRAVYVVYGTPKAQDGAAAKAERIVGYAAKGQARGYGGQIDVVVGVRADQFLTLYNCVVTSQNETPGLGANWQVKRTNKNFWQKLFGQNEGERISLQTDQFGSAPVAAGEPTETKGVGLRGLDAKGTVSAALKIAADGGKVDAISGATLSSRAVCSAVIGAVEKIAAVTTWDDVKEIRVPKDAAQPPVVSGATGSRP